MSPLEHLVQSHDMRLVAIAAAVCLLGGWATSRFFPRVVATSGAQRGGWVVLTALTCGVSVWCTHFISMLAHSTSSDVDLDGPLTMLSLGIALVGIGVGLTIAAARPSRGGAVLGGLFAGAAIAGLHYTGMAAYRTDGEVVWDGGLIALSIVFSLALPAAAMLAARRGDELGRNGQWLLLSVAVILLHFTGMAAFSPEAAHEHRHGDHGGLPGELQMLVVFIAALGFVVVVSGVAGYLIDDRSRAERDEQLRALASRDALTALPNRAGFTARLDEELAAARTHGRRFALISIDLTGFKGMNDLRGHGVGDELLRAVGRRLAELTEGRSGTFAARVGGDEFAVIIGGGHSVEAFLVDLERALTSEAALEPGGAEAMPGAAIGVAVYPDDARTADDLVAGADLAMQRSKAEVPSRPSFYDRIDDQRTRSRRELAADLDGAAERGELRLRYRPQADAGGRIVGYVALVHWEHPGYGPVLQPELLQLAQGTGLITAVGEWVLRTACHDAAGWDPSLRLVVDVSAQQLEQPGLDALIARVLDESGLEAARLEVELAADDVLDEGALAVLRGIAALGAAVALGGFGAGASSLALLRAFPFGRITVHASVLEADDEDGQRQAREIVAAIAGLGHALGMTVLADGAEGEPQLALLREAGVDQVRGSAIGRPVQGAALAGRLPIG